MSESKVGTCMCCNGERQIQLNHSRIYDCPHCKGMGRCEYRVKKCVWCGDEFETDFFDFKKANGLCIACQRR